VKLVGRKLAKRAVGGCANLEGSLQAIVPDDGLAEDFGKLAGCVAAQNIELEQTVLRGDEPLREDEIVHIGGANVRNAVSVAVHRNRRGKTRDRERSVELRKRIVNSVADPVARVEERCRDEDDDEESC
jgi:hypothetical protein